jgi:hypothetical protein
VANDSVAKDHFTNPSITFRDPKRLCNTFSRTYKGVNFDGKEDDT